MRLSSQNMYKYKISIVIVNFNNKALTLECLKSIGTNIKGILFEILLVDNGSNDGSVEAFKSFIKDEFWKDRLKLLQNKSNLGYAKANNQGIKIARGEYVLLLNNDTLLHKDSIKNLLSFVENNKDVGVVGSRLLNIDGTVQMSCYNFPTVINAIKEYWFGKKSLFEKFVPKGDAPSTVDAVVGAVFLITQDSLKKVGLLDERYFAYFEDLDYCRRVWKNGLKVYYLPDSVVTHYHGATFKKMSDESLQWRKLIPGSKIYHGELIHYIIFLIMWLGQKWQKYSNNKHP